MSKLQLDSPYLYLSNGICYVQFGWNMVDVKVLHCLFFLWEIDHISIRSYPSCGISVQLSWYSWVLLLFSSATVSSLMRCTHVELWLNRIFHFWYFIDNLKSHSTYAEQSQILPHTLHKSWIKSCEGISNMVANMWWRSTWVVLCGSESHLVALLLVCQTLPHNSVSNFCGMFMDVYKIAVHK